MFAYDGARYFGLVRQPAHPTVEAELLRVFKHSGLYRDLKDAMYRVAARTDRGVSAIGQVVSMDVLREPNLHGLNASFPEDIAVLCAVEVRSDFNARTQALSKHYRYVCDAPPGFDISIAQDAARLFERTHNFSHFCKREPGKPTKGKFEHAAIRGEKILKFDFVAPAFLRQQVRRVVQGLLEVGTGELGMGELKSMLEGRAKHSMRPAPAEGLFLADVKYPGLRFEQDPRAVKRFVSYLEGLEHPTYEAMAALLLHKGF